MGSGGLSWGVSSETTWESFGGDWPSWALVAFPGESPARRRGKVLEVIGHPGESPARQRERVLEVIGQ